MAATPRRWAARVAGLGRRRGGLREGRRRGSWEVGLAIDLDRPDRVLIRELCEDLLDDRADLVLVVAEVVEKGAQRRVRELQLRRGQLQVVAKRGVRRPSDPRSYVGMVRPIAAVQSAHAPGGVPGTSARGCGVDAGRCACRARIQAQHRPRLRSCRLRTPPAPTGPRSGCARRCRSASRPQLPGQQRPKVASAPSDPSRSPGAASQSRQGLLLRVPRRLPVLCDRGEGPFQEPGDHGRSLLVRPRDLGPARQRVTIGSSSPPTRTARRRSESGRDRPRRRRAGARRDRRSSPTGDIFGGDLRFDVGAATVAPLHGKTLQSVVGGRAGSAFDRSRKRSLPRDRISGRGAVRRRDRMGLRLSHKGQDGSSGQPATIEHRLRHDRGIERRRLGGRPGPARVADELFAKWRRRTRSTAPTSAARSRPSTTRVKNG